MKANCASIWSEESEMIAHLQSMFWSSSNADSCPFSPNSSDNSCVPPSMLPSTLFHPLFENEGFEKEQCQNGAGAVWCFDQQSQILAPITNEVTGNKRACITDENKSKNSKKSRTIALESTSSSIAPADEINTELVNQSCSWGCSSEDDSVGACELDMSTMLEEAVQYVKFLQLQ